MKNRLALRIKWLDLAVLCLSFAILTLNIGDYGFYEPHEGHFGGVGYEMLRRGDWITPTLNDAPYLNKPPLLYWLVAASMALFGVSEGAARLPVALAGWIGVIIAWKWARELWGVGAGRRAALMLSVTAGWFIFTHQLLIDVLLATLVLAVYYCLWRLVWQPKSWRYFLGLYVFLGLCLLAKGFLGIVLPLLGVIGLALVRRSLAVFRQIHLFSGISISLALALPWFIAVEAANPGFLFYFIYNEHLHRILDTRFPPDYEVSKVGVIGFLAITAVWCLPWILLLPQVIAWAWRQWQDKDRRHGEGILLLAIASVAPIILFLPLSSRLIYYSLPALPPYIILCAGWWSNHQSRHSKPVRLATIFILLGFAVFSTAFWLPNLAGNIPELANNPALARLIVAISFTIGLGTLLSGIFLLVRRPNFSLVALAVSWAIAYFFVTQGFVSYQNVRSSRTLIAKANACLEGAIWTFEGSRELGAAGAMSYYLNTASRDFKNIDAERNYRFFFVLADGGKNRLLPNFPGAPPPYAISKEKLQQYWQSSRPVVFVTDFLRQPGDPNDPPNLNLPDDAGEPLLLVGNRKLYGNAAARKQWCQLNSKVESRN